MCAPAWDFERAGEGDRHVVHLAAGMSSQALDGTTYTYDRVDWMRTLARSGGHVAPSPADLVACDYNRLEDGSWSCMAFAAHRAHWQSDFAITGKHDAWALSQADVGPMTL